MMLDAYFTGAVAELIERARCLKAKVPRNLRRRDYDALRRVCDDRLTDAIKHLQQLLDEPAFRNPQFRAQRLRAFRASSRISISSNPSESGALERADHADPFLNELLERVAKEIHFPHTTPIVTTLSQRYFYVISELNLLCVPLAEGDFLLHLPDLYHELAHPLLLVPDDPIIEPFQAAHLISIGTSYDYFNGEIEKERGYGPRQNRPLLEGWRAAYVKSWVTEFFCDGFAAATLGPAFAWAHLHLCAKRGGNPFIASAAATSHPAEDARMSVILKVLSQLGHADSVTKIRARWSDLMEESGLGPSLNTVAATRKRCLRISPSFVLRELMQSDVASRDPTPPATCITFLTRRGRCFGKLPPITPRGSAANSIRFERRLFRVRERLREGAQQKTRRVAKEGGNLHRESHGRSVAYPRGHALQSCSHHVDRGRNEENPPSNSGSEALSRCSPSPSVGRPHFSRYAASAASYPTDDDGDEAGKQRSSTVLDRRPCRLRTPCNLSGKAIFESASWVDYEPRTGDGSRHRQLTRPP